MTGAGEVIGAVLIGAVIALLGVGLGVLVMVWRSEE